MEPLSAAYIAVSSICVAVGMLHLIIYFRRPDLKIDLIFAIMALLNAFSVIFELKMHHSGSLPGFTRALKTTLMLQGFLWGSFVWFIHFYTRAARLWMVCTCSALYGGAVIINFIYPSGVLFHEITSLQPLVLSWGERIFTADGTPNPWRLLPDIGWFLMLYIAVESTVRMGRRGEKRRALIFGLILLLSLGLGYLHGTLIDFGIADPPSLIFLTFLGLILLMSFSLAGEVVSASVLSREVRANETRWRQLHENIHLLAVVLDQNARIEYVNPHFTKITGYSADDVIGRKFIDYVFQKDKDAAHRRFLDAMSGAVHPLSRSLLSKKNGEKVLIAWSNVALSDAAGQPTGLLGIGEDVTALESARQELENMVKDRDRALDDLQKLKEKLEAENITLKELIQVDSNGFKEIVGQSNPILYVLTKVKQVAETDAVVLIQGETGVGKGLFAKAIHRASDRADRPFVAVNCAALPSPLIESELFGHEEGAFTGAAKMRRGRFELADGGTLFLDEIGELPPEMQSKLLKAVQDHTFERVGGGKTFSVDVRIIAATNRNLAEEVSEGRFRADLYYRLNVYPITIPPLRQRRDDIPLLVKHFVSLFSKKYGKNIDEVPIPLMEHLLAYDWPGNVRELQNIIERAVITASGPVLSLPEALTASPEPSRTETGTCLPDLQPLHEVERLHILKALECTDWRISGPKGAAAILKLNPSTLRNRMKKHKLSRP